MPSLAGLESNATRHQTIWPLSFVKLNATHKPRSRRTPLHLSSHGVCVHVIKILREARCPVALQSTYVMRAGRQTQALQYLFVPLRAHRPHSPVTTTPKTPPWRLPRMADMSSGLPLPLIKPVQSGRVALIAQAAPISRLSTYSRAVISSFRPVAGNAHRTVFTQPSPRQYQFRPRTWIICTAKRAPESPSAATPSRVSRTSNGMPLLSPVLLLRPMVDIPRKISKLDLS